MLKLRQHAAHLKDPAFSEEGEWRLVVITMPDDERWAVRSARNSLLPCVTLKLGETCTASVDVVVGPGTINPHRAQMAANYYLRKIKLQDPATSKGAMARASKVPYRYLR